MGLATGMSSGAIVRSRGLAAPLIPPVTTNLLGIWQIDGNGTITGNVTGRVYTGRLNDSLAIKAAMGAADTAYHVTQWDDLSGNNNHGTNEVSYAPTWVGTGGLQDPSVLFTEVDRLEVGGINSGTANTYYCVCKPTTASVYHSPMGDTGFSGSGAAFKLRNNGDIYGLVRDAGGSDRNTHTSAYSANTVLRLAIAFTSSNLVSSVNGSELSRAHTRETTGTPNLELGREGAEEFNGYATVFIAYSGQHDGTDRATMMTWLSDNYI